MRGVDAVAVGGGEGGYLRSRCVCCMHHKYGSARYLTACNTAEYIFFIFIFFKYFLTVSLNHLGSVLVICILLTPFCSATVF